MSFRLKSPRHRSTVALLGALAVIAALVALPAVAAAATSTSAALKQATGYSAAQLQAEPVCGAPQPGQMRCLAQVLTVKSSGGVVHLRHEPHAKPMLTTRHRADLAVATSATSTPATAQPQAGTAASLQWAYDTTWLSANGGGNDTVAIIDAYDDPNAASDMANFRAANGLASCAVGTCFEQYNQSGALIDGSGSGAAPREDSTGGWEVEESLDLDAVSSICPFCKIDLIEARSTSDANLEAAVAVAHSLNANQISMSFGGDTTPGSDPENGHWAFPGQASLAAVGDDSYQGPGDVEYPAAYPDVTSVGGTSLSPDSTVARGFDESAWAKCGSACGTESGCDTSEATPGWQPSAATSACDAIENDLDEPQTGGRAYNDISADADPNTGLEIYDTVGGSQGCSTWCIVGGTSLATPLTAAFEAVTAVSGTSSPQWTYTDASLLNDALSGTNGTCPTGAALLCDAAAGWDGPTGNGSISGDVVSGGPGIGAESATGVNETDVTLAGGVYPNGEATNSYWAYWVDGTTGMTTDTATIPTSGTGVQSVSDTLCGSLTANTTYDYELVATSTSGTEDGYQGSFTTPAVESAPTASAPPTISGSAEPGQTLTAQDANWNDPSCNSSPTYQWQESPNSSFNTSSTVGTSLSYTLTSADLGMYLRLVATESNGAGPGTSTSAVVGPVTVPTNSTTTTTTPTTTTPTTTTPTTTTPTTTTPTTTTPTRTTGTTSTTDTVRFYRCARTCVLLNTHGATTYQPRKADYGKYIKVVTTITSRVSQIDTASVITRWVGPISSSTAGAVTLTGGAHVASVIRVRSSTRVLLAQVRIAKRSAKALTLVVKRQGRTRTQVWAYVVRKGAVVSCTAAHTLHGSLRLSVGLKAGQTVKLVAVQA